MAQHRGEIWRPAGPFGPRWLEDYAPDSAVASAPTGADIVRAVLDQFAMNFLLNDLDVDRASTWSAISSGVPRFAIPGHVPRRRDSAVERVHQARVSIRRIRSTLRTFDALIDPAWSTTMMPDLTWYARILGEIRDLDVLRDAIEASLDVIGDDDRVKVISVLDDTSERATSIWGHSQTTPQYVRLIDKVAGIDANARFRSKALGPAQRVLSRQLDRAWGEVRAADRTARRDPSDHRLHQLRITLKRLQYSCEAVGVVAGESVVRLARDAQALQTKLGTSHDRSVAIDWLRQFDDASMSPDAVDRLVLVHDQARRSARRGWRSDMDRLERRWWRTIRK